MTPREFSYALEGRRTQDERQDERAWAKCATLIAYLGWHKDPTSPKQIFDRIMGTGDGNFDHVAGFGADEEKLEYFLKHQKKPGA